MAAFLDMGRKKNSRKVKCCFICSAQGGDVKQSSSKPPTLRCYVILLFILMSIGCTLGLDQIVYSAGERFITFYHFVFCKVMILNYYSLPNWEFLLYYIWCSLYCVLSCFAVVDGNLDHIDQIKLCFSSSGTSLPLIMAQSTFIIFICGKKNLTVMFAGKFVS